MKCKTDFAYQAVYRYLMRLVNEAQAASPRRLPSLRHLAQRLQVSISTVQSAYSLLEKEGRVCSVPKSGYYSMPDTHCDDDIAGGDDSQLLEVFCRSRLRPGMCWLGSDEPAVLPGQESAVLAMERVLARLYPLPGNGGFQPLGDPELRAALSARYTRDAEHGWFADDVCIGPDLAAMLDSVIETLCLRAKTVLVESPCPWSLLQRFQAFDIRIVEVPLDETGGIDLQLLDRALTGQRVSLAVLSSALNPIRGSARPWSNTRLVAERLNRQGIWVLENDSHGDLLFDCAPVRLRDLVDPERLITMGSFAPVLGPNAPYGYLLCKAARSQWQHHFLLRAFELSPLRQKAIARLYASGRLSAHLTHTVTGLVERMQQVSEALDRHLGQTLRYERAAGGSGIWAESVNPVNMRRVFDLLRRKRIVISPGELFSTQGWHRQFLRISCTLDRGLDIDRMLIALRETLEEVTG